MRCLARHGVATAAALALVATAPGCAFAWGATGHRYIGQLGEASLPAALPAFLRTTDAIADVGEYAREPDRWKSDSKVKSVHDAERDPAHFLDLDDTGKILGGPDLASLPATRAEYDTALRKVGSDSWRAGYLPYAIIDGWQQLAKDFAYWRILTAAIPREQNPDHKAYMERDLVRREALTLRDIGVWAHYVGDASQPMHVSVHFNGWGPYPNPKGYTQDRVHAPFEGEFVRTNVSEEAVRAAMAPPVVCADPIEACVARYLAQTGAEVEPFYALQKQGAFAGPDPRGEAFAAARLADGAAALRDMIVSAWTASAIGQIGYPPISVDQVVRGGFDPYDALYGED